MPYTEVMHKFKSGTLRSGNKRTGPKVTKRAQALAIMLSEKRAAEGGKAEYQPRHRMVSLSTLRRPRAR